MEAILSKWVTELFEEEEFSDCFLLEVKLHPPRKFEVFFDADKGVTFRRCQQISRKLEEKMDQEPAIQDNYILEVSSGGAERPLSDKRQYPKHLQRSLRVSTLNENEFVGKLIAVNDQGITLLVKEKIKGKKFVEKEIEVPFENIVKSIVQLSFK